MGLIVYDDPGKIVLIELLDLQEYLVSVLDKGYNMERIEYRFGG